jgi:integrase
VRSTGAPFRKVVALKDSSPETRSGYVFAAPRGGFMHAFDRYWYPALHRAEIPDFHFHDLRHTFASRLAMKGVDLYRVQTLMGHKTPEMTKRYAHLNPDTLREAVERLDAEPAISRG